MKSLISNQAESNDQKLNTLNSAMCSFTNTFLNNSWASRFLNLFLSKSTFSSSSKLLDSDSKDYSVSAGCGAYLWGCGFGLRASFLVIGFVTLDYFHWAAMSCFFLYDLRLLPLSYYIVFFLTPWLSSLLFNQFRWL